MGFIDKLMGRPSAPPAHAGQGGAPSGEDPALARYRYLLRTAPPEAIEQVHAEAFARLGPEQRQELLRQIAAEAPPDEAGHVPRGEDDPRAMARFATRAELRRPGMLERILGGGSGYGYGGPSFGTSLATSFLAGAVGSVVASQLLGGMHDGFFGGDDEGFAHTPSGSTDDWSSESDTGSGEDLGFDGGDGFGDGGFDV